MTGIELIAKEREEHFSKHNRTTSDDLEYNDQDQLADFARILIINTPITAHDPLTFAELKAFLPKGWNPDMCEKMLAKPYKERLVIAGALLAAELDRIIAILIKDGKEV